MINNITKILMTMALTVTIASVSKAPVNAFDNSNAQLIEAPNNKPSTQEYLTEDGKTNTIYWLTGLSDMPKMTIDKSLQNTKGYFNIINDNGTYSYEKEYEENHGYYDLNKNEYRRDFHNEPGYGMIAENNLCYLSSATNLLHWWFDQNEPYIKEYIKRIQDGTLIQPEGLIDITNTNLFNKMMVSPELQLVDGYYRQEIRYSNISWPHFKLYFEKKSGFFSDKVWDFFFNGYEAFRLSDINNPGKYKMDKRGGFFYPVFQKDMLTTRVNGGNYETISREIKEHLDNGDGIALYYYTSNTDASHALTLWGAEYDSDNMLKRVYVTDSDDYNHTINGSKNLKGVFGLDVHVDEQGLAHLGNNDLAYKNKLIIQGMSTLSLGQDRLKKVVYDSPEASTPIINEEPKDYSYGNYNEYTRTALEVEAITLDTGKLSYQWYEANNINSEGVKIKGATNSYFIPNIIDTKIDKYYYCVITNTKQGRTASIKSRTAKITIDSTLEDTKAPIINGTSKPEFVYAGKYPGVLEFTNPGLISVDASSVDGGEISYQWYKKGFNDGGYHKLNGETKNYIVPNTTNDSAYYKCLVTNTNDKHSGSKTYTITGIELKVELFSNLTPEKAPLPYIIEHSKDQSYLINTRANPLSVTAATGDGGSLSYQWYLIEADGNEKKLSGETNSTLNIKTDTAGIFKYRCDVTNTNHKATNQKATRPSEIMTVTIVSEDPVLSYTSKTSLSIAYNPTTHIPSTIKLRFGFKAETGLLDLDNKEYGMIILAANDIKNINKLDNIDLDTLNNLKSNGFANEFTPVKVDNTYSQFAWVINNITPDRYDFEFSAYIYELDKNTNTIKLSLNRNASIYSVKSEYILMKDELKLSDEIIKVLNNIK